MINITDEQLSLLLDATVELTKLRQNECKHLCVENIAPEILKNLIKAVGEINSETIGVKESIEARRSQRKFNAEIAAMACAKEEYRGVSGIASCSCGGAPSLTHAIKAPYWAITCMACSASLQHFDDLPSTRVIDEWNRIMLSYKSESSDKEERF